MDAVSVPGRVNLIGEHIDYHGLPVLPIAISRSCAWLFRPRSDRLIRAASSAPYGAARIRLDPRLRAGRPRRLAELPAGRGAGRDSRCCASSSTPVGIDAAIDVRPAGRRGPFLLDRAAGRLHSRAAARQPRSPTFEELMAVLPDGEQFVGTRGGGMDHAAVLASRPGCASLIDFEPLSVRHIPVPPGLGISGGPQPGDRRKIGPRARRLQRPPARRDRRAATSRTRIVPGRVGRPRSAPRQHRGARRLPPRRHRSPPRRTPPSVRWNAPTRPPSAASCSNPTPACATASKSAVPALDRLVEAAMDSGAPGARLTGAGFGGCAVVFARQARHCRPCAAD